MTQKRGFPQPKSDENQGKTPAQEGASVGIEFDGESLQLLHFLLESKGNPPCPGCQRPIDLSTMQIVVEAGTNHVFIMNTCMACYGLTGQGTVLARLGR